MSVATSACVVCHRRKPRTEMVRVQSTERSGHSNGGGFSFSGGKKANPRYFGSRRHYHRVKEEWWCKSCYQTHLVDAPTPWFLWPIFYFVLIYVCYGVGIFTEDLIFQNGGEYSELVFGTIIDMTWAGLEWAWYTFWGLVYDGLKWLENRLTII